MTPMRRIVMIGAAAALLSVGAVGCSDDGEVTAPGPGPAVEEPSEAEEPEASDAGGDREPTSVYADEELNEDDLFAPRGEDDTEEAESAKDEELSEGQSDRRLDDFEGVEEEKITSSV